MKPNSRIKDILQGPGFNLPIMVLIFASLVMLIVHNIGDYNVKTDKIFYLVDEIVLLIFTCEFLLKISFLGKNYFFKELGWIDLLAALPVLYPVFNYVVLRINTELLLTYEGESIAIILRGFKFLRFLRIMRAVRLLKVFKYIQMGGDDLNRRKYSFTVPVVFSMILFVSGFFLISNVENDLRTDKLKMMTKLLETCSKENINKILKIYPDILMIKNGEVFERTISDKEIKKIYEPFEHSTVKTENGFILYSVKGILRISKTIEIAIMIIVFIYIFSTYCQYMIDLSMIKKKRADGDGQKRR
jgi:hypothetical protein